MSVAVTVRTHGADDVGRMIKKYGDRAKKGYHKGLRGWGERVMAQAKREVPVDDGPLRSSGFVEDEFRLDRFVIVRLSFGGPARGNFSVGWVGYAIIQHERLDFNHTTGKAKYLEDPVREWANRVGPIVTKAIKREVAGL